jgi:hypothetical protein
MGGGFVPEGQHDRSLARSAWGATQKSRPVGYGLIRADVRTDSICRKHYIKRVRAPPATREAGSPSYIAFRARRVRNGTPL